MQSARSPRALESHADEQLLPHDETAVRLRAMDLDRGAAVSGDERAGIAADDVQGRTVGRATYVRVYGPRAEVELEVDDAFWHRGLPEVLLASLCARAACLGISTFLARVRASDMRLLALLREEFAARESRDGAYVEVEFSTSRRPTDDRVQDALVPQAAVAEGRDVAHVDAAADADGIVHERPCDKQRTQTRTGT